LGGKLYFVDSGTSALALAVLSAIKCKQLASNETSEVIIPAYCCPDIVAAVNYAGAKPVLVDFDRESPRLSVVGVENQITENTVAIVAVNFLGVPERIDRLAQIAIRNDISLIHDSCQFYPVKPIERDNSDYTIYSFGRGKPVSVFHGGLLVTRQELSLELIQNVCQRGSGLLGNTRYAVKSLLQEMGRNPMIYGYAVACGWAGVTHIERLKSISSMLDSAKSYLGSNIDAYHGRQNPIASGMKRVFSQYHADIVDLTGQVDDLDGRAILRYSVLMEDGNQQTKFIEALRNSGIGASTLYGRILPRIPGCEISYGNESYSNANEFAKRLVTLPAHSDVPKNVFDEIEKACMYCGIGKT